MIIIVIIIIKVRLAKIKSIILERFKNEINFKQYLQSSKKKKKKKEEEEEAFNM